MLSFSPFLVTDSWSVAVLQDSGLCSGWNKERQMSVSLAFSSVLSVDVVWPEATLSLVTPD